MRKAAYISLCVTWALLFFIGSSIIYGVSQHDFAFGPSAAQIKTFALAPAVMLAANILVMVFLRKIPGFVLGALFVVQIVLVVVWLMSVGGGV